MTRQTFYRRLEAAADAFDWEIRNYDGAIRTAETPFACPISSLDNPPIWALTVAASIIHLGLERDWAKKVVRAADNKLGHDPRIRAALLRRLNLEDHHA